MLDRIDNEILREEINKTQVVVMAGGKAKRMGIDLPKCLLEVSGKKLIDRCIESLAGEGFKQFLFLLGHRHELVVDHIGDGSKYGIRASYSIDRTSEFAWGKGKAFKNALLNNKIDASQRSLVLFPDDLVLEDRLFSNFLANHIEFVTRWGCAGSVILVQGTEYPFGVAEIDDRGIVSDFIEKPMVKRPTSIGIYMFEPPVYDIIETTINLDDPNPVDLESTIFPRLSKSKKLSSFFISYGKWLPINTIKEYEQAIKILAAGQNQSTART